MLSLHGTENPIAGPNVEASRLLIGFGSRLYYVSINIIRKPQNPIAIIQALTLSSKSPLQQCWVARIQQTALVAEDETWA